MAPSWASTSFTVPAMSSRRKASRLVSSSRPVMPKSSRAVRPSGRTNRFPPCRSPWKIPWRMAPSTKPIMPVRTTASVSTPASRMPATSSKRNPSRRSITSTRGVTSVGVRAGDDVAPLAELGERAGDVEHVLGLEPEVELLGDRLGEQLDQCGRVGQRGDRDASDQLRGQPRHDPQVVADQPGDRRPLDLDHHLLAGAERRRVHLGDRGRGQRRAVDPPEHLAERAARGRPRSPRGRPGTARRAPGRGSSLNSSTSSAGKMPSPDEMICPSLM